MDLRQSFETSIENVDLDIDIEPFRFIFLPAQGDRNPSLSVDEIALEWECEVLGIFTSASQLPPVLVALLLDRDASEALALSGRTVDADPEILSFVERIAYTSVVPTVTSPLDLRSLADVLTMGSGFTAGSWAGVVASGGTPLILVTLPAGMLIGGAAGGVARALEEGLYEKVRGWFRRGSSSGVHEQILGLKGWPGD